MLRLNEQKGACMFKSDICREPEPQVNPERVIAVMCSILVLATAAHKLGAFVWALSLLY
jgi:hypothetical protein